MNTQNPCSLGVKENVVQCTTEFGSKVSHDWLLPVSFSIRTANGKYASPGCCDRCLCYVAIEWIAGQCVEVPTYDQGSVALLRQI